MTCVPVLVAASDPLPPDAVSDTLVDGPPPNRVRTTPSTIFVSPESASTVIGVVQLATTCTSHATTRLNVAGDRPVFLTWKLSVFALNGSTLAAAGGVTATAK